MSFEDLRDMKTMLAQLETDGSLDHTEGLLSWFATGRDPSGKWGTDFSGAVWNAKLSEIERLKGELEEVKKEKEALQSQLESVNEENKGHTGRISSIEEEKNVLRIQVEKQLMVLKNVSLTEFASFNTAFHKFQEDITEEVLKIQKEVIGGNLQKETGV